MEILATQLTPINTPKETIHIFNDTNYKNIEASIPIERRIGIILRYQNPRSYYLVQHYDGNINILRFDHDQYILLASTPAGEGEQLTAKIQGNKITATVENTLTVENNEIPNEGKIGVWGEPRNITINILPEPKPEPKETQQTTQPEQETPKEPETNKTEEENNENNHNIIDLAKDTVITAAKVVSAPVVTPIKLAKKLLDTLRGETLENKILKIIHDTPNITEGEIAQILNVDVEKVKETVDKLIAEGKIGVQE
ncbi:MAG: winged helix-turn-helix transcriptional regulator [Candidatus Baldrarchaeia archaeon]